MKLLSKLIDRDNSGQITLMPEEAEDMWHTYNLLQIKDSLRASTFRKVQTESSTGSVGSNRVRTTLTICVETIDFDAQACMLRVKGTNIQENDYVKMGAYHTIELELNRKFTLAKKLWDSVVLERIEQACDPGYNADVGAVIMQEGLAHICLVTSSMTVLRAKVETTIPRKRKGSCTQHDKEQKIQFPNCTSRRLTPPSGWRMLLSDWCSYGAGRCGCVNLRKIHSVREQSESGDTREAG
ncbi:protein pelota homolog [Scyliorhinus canicula]|uniref:protein pelota homolog n=1 Tax=Scyliorhinus canicula TaxID=7830 RepID=UPI0018F57F52|nr:protein pelota homolog [Scyliorhinus canicula]